MWWVRFPELEGGAVEVFEAAVEGFDGSVAGACLVEVGRDVSGAALQGSS